MACVRRWKLNDTTERGDPHPQHNTTMATSSEQRRDARRTGAAAGGGAAAHAAAQHARGVLPRAPRLRHGPRAAAGPAAGPAAVPAAVSCERPLPPLMQRNAEPARAHAHDARMLRALAQPSCTWSPGTCTVSNVLSNVLYQHPKITPPWPAAACCAYSPATRTAPWNFLLFSVLRWCCCYKTALSFI